LIITREQRFFQRNALYAETICVLALVAAWVPGAREEAPEESESNISKKRDRTTMNGDAVKEPSFKIEVNGRPERLNDLVVTARFESPKPVSVGYTDDGMVTSLTLSIDRFEWEFHPEPIEEEDRHFTRDSENRR
jgi:hypothetical protein